MTKLALGFLAFTAICHIAAAEEATLKAIGLRCEYRTDPCGIDQPAAAAELADRVASPWRSPIGLPDPGGLQH